jgi:hypothetical protein
MSQAFTKFHQKNQVVYMGQQVATGIPVTDACLGTITLAGTAAGSAVTLTFGSAGNTIVASAAVAATAVQVVAALIAFSKGTLASGAALGGVTITAAGTAAYKAGPFLTGQAFNKFTFSAVPNNTSAVFVRDNTGTALPTTLAPAGGTGLTVASYLTAAMTGSAGLAVTSISGSPTRETGSVTYIAGALSRNEFSYQKDIYIDLSIETPQQILSSHTTPASLAALLNTTNAVGAGIFSLFEACGGFMTLSNVSSALYPTGFVQVDNTQQSNTLVTADLHLSSSDDAVNDKLWKFYDLQGMFDVNASMGDLPMLKFQFKGNVSDPVNNLVPQAFPNMGNQYVDVTPSILPSTLITSQVVPISDTFGTARLYAALTFTLPTDIVGSTNTSNLLNINFTAAHNIPVGDLRMIKIASVTGVNASIYNATYVAQATSANDVVISLSAVPTAIPPAGTAAIGDTAAIPFNFGSLTAANFLGFGYSRFMAGQLIGFTKSASATDISATVLQDQSGTTNWDPDATLSQFFAVQVKWGLGNTLNTTMIWTNVQVTNVKEGKIGDYLARDVTLRNTGNSILIYS